MREQLPASGGSLVGSSQVESRHDIGYGLERPVHSYLHLRQMLVESKKNFAVLEVSLPHIWKYCISLEMLLFFFLNFILCSALDA